MKPKKEGICDKCSSLLIQRDDEKPDVVKKRLEVYKNQTAPLIEYYRKRKKLYEIDAYPDIVVVSRKVFSLLDK